LTDLTVGEFAARLASQEPAPGGGSAAALSGLLGASLVSMAVGLTRGRPDFVAHEALLAARQTELARLREDLQLLIDRDAAAFSAVMAAYGLPQAGEGERQDRAAAIQEAMAEAAAVPLLTARACLAVLEIAKDVAGKVNPHAASDLAMGALACHAGLTGALLNTAINLPALSDETLVRNHRGQIRLLRAAAAELAAAIQAKVYGEPTFAVMRE
ncbi:MAG TPA: cyclodeaminase/cyclohydrolase family protein, partial [Negativicutes bacterium]|nr:cyclodeaminase/cyclohydrolase family protein [Negativicutes bacterium]